MNGYARVSHIMADVAGVVGNANLSNLMATYVRAIDQTSQEFRSQVARQFHSSQETRYFNGRASQATSFPVGVSSYGGFYSESYYGSSGRLTGTHRADIRRLLLGCDLVSITTIKVDTDADGVFETTLTAGTDYRLWPYNAAAQDMPYRAVELVPIGGQLSAWPVAEYCVQIVGLFGYSNETEDTLQTVQDTTSQASGSTTLTVQSTADIDPGETLVIGTEQEYVVSVNDPTTLTVTRGINGTTAAAHLNGVTVYRRRYPRDVEEAVKERVVGKRWDTQSGYAGAAALMGESTQGGGSRASYARWVSTVNNYLDPAGIF